MPRNKHEHKAIPKLVNRGTQGWQGSELAVCHSLDTTLSIYQNMAVAASNIMYFHMQGREFFLVSLPFIKEKYLPQVSTAYFPLDPIVQNQFTYLFSSQLHAKENS